MRPLSRRFNSDHVCVSETGGNQMEPSLSKLGMEGLLKQADV